MEDKCPKCSHRKATAQALTRKDAERIMREIAQDMRQTRPGLSVAESEEIAMESILTKRPTLLVKCDSCTHEWFE